MPEEPDLYEEIVRLRTIGSPAALCTVLLTRGSTPGKETMKMLVRSDGSILGSIGGGCVEADVIAMGREVVATDKAQTTTFRLNQKDVPESGLICGGQVTILVEPVVPPTVVFFGGGHVAKASARVAKECGFRVLVCDDRPEFSSQQEHPGAHAVFAGSWEDAVAHIAPAEHHYLVILTRGHSDDACVLRAIHAQGLQPKYLGMLGSRGKKAGLTRLLEDEGIPREWLDGVRTPIGLEIGARSSGEIAVSLGAELVRLRRQGRLEPLPARKERHRKTV